MRIAILGLATALMVCAAQPGAAATVVDYKPTGYGGNVTISSKAVEKGFIATGFALPSATTLTGAGFTVTTSTMSVPANPWSVTWRFLSVGSDSAPAATLAEGMATTFTRSVVGYPADVTVDVRFDFALPSVALAAGNYFLALHSDSPDLIALRNASEPGSVGYRSNEGRNWRFPRPGGYAISLSDDPVVTAVPEPATWAMMLIGFAMIGAARRYHRRPAVTIG